MDLEEVIELSKGELLLEEIIRLLFYKDKIELLEEKDKVTIIFFGKTQGKILNHKRICQRP